MWSFIQFFFGPMVFSLINFSFSTHLNENTTSVIEDYEVYTDAELRNIRVFRELTSDVLEKEYEQSDDFLIRWLRGSGMEIPSANKTLRQALKWRADNNMDSILNKTFTVFKKYQRPCFVDGFDIKGGPIVIYKLLGVDVRDLLAKGYLDSLVQKSDQCMERYFQESISGGPKSEQIRLTPGIGIIDVQGLSMKQHGCPRCVEFYIKTAVNSILYYPQSSRLNIVINASKFTKGIIEMMKPYLTPHSKSKDVLQVFGTDRVESSKFLLSVISKDQLLKEYGGVKQMSVNW